MADAALMGFVGAKLLNLSRLAKDVPDSALDDRTKRLGYLLKVSSTVPPPGTVALQKELASVIAQMSGNYSTAESCSRVEGETICKNLDALEKDMTLFKEYDTLLSTWVGWRKATARIGPLFSRYVALGNEGAKNLMYPNMADLWRSAYDMPPYDFGKMVESLWSDVRPLYEDLHCFIRGKLHDAYPTQVSDGFDKFIPAHLLGDMWAQDWTNLWGKLQLMPYPNEPVVDINSKLVESYDQEKMVKDAEAFFVGLGFDPLPQSFWKESLFRRPSNKKVVCHASAWDVHYNDDLRLKACLNVDTNDYFTVHHELGHLYYFHSYYTRNVLFQNGANDGFHEAVGDTIALSLTPEYLKKKGLLKDVGTSKEAVINNQLLRALSKVAFLPFGYMIDKWRWDVFEGRVRESNWNEHYWRLTQAYQGVASPVKRGADAFDPGAKYHIAANVPYMRYFLAAILQFQLHRALCAKAGHKGPLYNCSIAESKEAGSALKEMLSLGASKPWQEALKTLSGETAIDPSALIDYFSPLQQWLQQQNKANNRQCGWPRDGPILPLNENNHLGLMIAVAAAAAIAIFLGAALFNKFASRNDQYEKLAKGADGQKRPNTGDYEGL